MADPDQVVRDWLKEIGYPLYGAYSSELDGDGGWYGPPWYIRDCYHARRKPGVMRWTITEEGLERLAQGTEVSRD